MFVFDRSALAVLVPLALLAGVVFYSSRTPPAREAQQQVRTADQAVAANLPSR